jgi:photosystem II stability/assembly factor-like uncharacterized protein
MARAPAILVFVLRIKLLEAIRWKTVAAYAKIVPIMRLRATLGFCIAAAAAHGQAWAPQHSGTTASLRGISAVSAKTGWASGTGGTVLRTTDGGATWQAGLVPDADALDFRDVEAVDAQRAYLLSSGPGDKSRIYKTTDGGRHWTLQLTNPDAAGFFDALAFWDAERGMAMGDPVDGRFVVFTTRDGGAHWERGRGPEALPKEGAFAASGTCLVARGTAQAWFATGGPGGARVFRSMDAGATWAAAATGIRNDSASAGVFSISFAKGNQGVAVGGDYSKPGEESRNVAVTTDGGATWRAVRGTPPKGYRSAVAYAPARKVWIAVGTTGSSISRDGGESWTEFDSGGYNAVSVAPDGAVWAVGAEGRVAWLR